VACFGTAGSHGRTGTLPQRYAFYSRDQQQGVTAMPVLLWFGIPVLLVGSGFVIYRIVGG
jgi:hypothetical protein